MFTIACRLVVNLSTCFTSSLEPASYTTQNSSFKLFIPLWTTFIWTWRSNVIHTAITFHHFFNVSLWAQNLLFRKILSSTLVCLSDWSYGYRPLTGLGLDLASGWLVVMQMCLYLVYSWYTELTRVYADATLSDENTAISRFDKLPIRVLHRN